MPPALRCEPAAGEARGRPRFEVADIFRAHGDEYRRSHRLTKNQHRVMAAIEGCRTAALGGHVEACDRCGARRVTHNSCRNRHCPKCQSLARAKWLEAQAALLLPIGYFHVVFTLPHELNPLIAYNRRLAYQLLFRAASQTLRKFGADPRHLGAELAVTAILHTWGQNLSQHVHLHCVVSGGGLSHDRKSWVVARRGFLFPVRALSKAFRGKYLHPLGDAFAAGKLRFPQTMRESFVALISGLNTKQWVVFAKKKKPFAGPEHVLAYLGRYTHRVAISNDRIVHLADGTVCFRWKDYADGARVKLMELHATEFIRRFLLHVMPSHFMRIRHFGLLANRHREEKLSRCREILGTTKRCDPPTEQKTVDLMRRICGVDLARCPACHDGTMIRVEVLPRGANPVAPLDSS